MDKAKNLIYLSKLKQDFEPEYIQVRQAEGRLYSDKIVNELPEISVGHPLAKEWQMRKKSAKMLVNFFLQENFNGNLLEVGCGNGWLCRYISAQTNLKVSGLDVNKQELEQAVRISEENTVNFFYGDIYEDIFPPQSFDVILFSSSLQYFPNVTEVLKRAAYFLKNGGTVAISDTPFYSGENRERARQQTVQYYTGLGFPEMAAYYYHHSKKDIMALGAKYIYNPYSFKQKLLQKIFPTFGPAFPIFKIPATALK